MTELPAPTIPALPRLLADLDHLVPVQGLAALVQPGSPRWSYGALALSLVGPVRNDPRLPENVAVPNRARLDDLRTLIQLVDHLDGLAGQQPADAPEAPPELVCRVPTSQSLWLAPPVLTPLRWPALRVVQPWMEDRLLTGLPRAARPALRAVTGEPVAAAVAADGRLAALAALLDHAQVNGYPLSREAVLRLAGWCVGPQRASGAAAALSGSYSYPAGESSQDAGVEEAGLLLAQLRPGEVADRLLTDGAEEWAPSCSHEVAV